MGVSSDPAGTLGEKRRISGITPLENYLDTPEHLTRAPGVDNLSSGHLYFDPQVALYSGDRIDRNFLSHV